MFTTKCELIGSLEFSPWSAMFEQLRRVYGTNGDSPALNANGGGIAKSRFLKSIFANRITELNQQMGGIEQNA